jgi:glyceraldehyde-3-phosphate dehydrogenase (NAD(P))
MKKVKVAVNGYGVIGKRIADAVVLQDDMELAGVCDINNDWRIKVALTKGYNVFAAHDTALKEMTEVGIDVIGTLPALIMEADIIIDCTPKKVSANNISLYKKANKKFIVQGGEKHEVTGHSFNAETNYASALNIESTRVVSCNTTSILRTLGSLKRAGLLKSARGTLLRRATDPWESHISGIMNTLVPEQSITSHQGPDAQTVDPDLDVVTAAVKVPETLSHLHYWFIKLSKKTTKETVLNAFKAESTRIAFIKYNENLSSNNALKEMLLDIGRPRGDMYEVAIWEDMLKVENDELFYAYIVDNQAIVVPETIDAIRAMLNIETNAVRSITKTNLSLGITQNIMKL